MTQRYDVIISGGGPAGATAAFFLGQAGRKVLVLEKELLPRYKTCGGAVSGRVLAQFPFSFDPVIQTRVNAVSYALGDQVMTIPVREASLCMVMRSEFDAFLLEHAQAEIRQGMPVRAVQETAGAVAVETVAGECIEADYLVAADGANSMVARSLGLRRKKILAGAVEIEAAVPEATLRRFMNNVVLIFGDIGVGYAWIFPKADHLSIGIGALNPRPGDLQVVLERVMKRYGISIQSPERHGHTLPVYSRREVLGTHRCLLAGDSAGLVDPFTGEGIRFAIKSGRQAAEAILAGRPESYTARVDRSIGRNHRLGNGMNKVFYRFTRPSFNLALRNPVVSHALMGLFDDRIGYASLLLTIAGTFPLATLTKKIKLEEFLTH